MQKGRVYQCLTQETTTRICSQSFKKLFIYTLIFALSFFSLFSQENKEWTIAAEKFVFARGQNKNSVTSGVAESIPKNILENLNQTLNRNIKADESLDRTRYELRQKRQSLYLQLSSEYQKRDALFLSYSGKKLDNKIKEAQEEIAKINKQIDDNLEELKKAEEASQTISDIKDVIADDGRPISETEKMSTFFKNIVTNEKAVITSEKIKLYNNDSTSLFTPSEEAVKRGYESTYFAEEMYSKNINSLITGTISSYGKYISISVDLYGYPGAKKIGSVMEIGSTNEMELITSSIVRQLIPLLTNSMPVEVTFNMEPDVPIKDVQIYIDDILQKTNDNKIVINSGVHSFQIVAKGYRALSTSYYFEGNVSYNIEIKLEEKKEGTVNIQLANALSGNLYTNGLMAEKKNDQSYKIKINGQQVLGEFISEDGKTSFFYVPEKLFYDENYVKINPKPIDRAEKIDKRRKWMYGAYSAFMISLIPSFISRGIYENNLYSYNKNSTPENYKKANAWYITTNVFSGLSIGLAVFWGYELVRYLIAADSVLPETAKQLGMNDIIVEEVSTPPIDTEEIGQDSDIKTDVETEESKTEIKEEINDKKDK